MKSAIRLLNNGLAFQGLLSRSTPLLARGLGYPVVTVTPGTFANHVKYASTKYKAALVKEFGKPLVIGEVKRKSLKKNDVRVAVYCCGVNTVDKHNILGEIEPKPALPFVPGFEVCGEVLEVSAEIDNPKIKPGERVIALNKEFQGGFAEEIVIPSKDVWLIDNSISFAVGASLVNSYATASLALTRRAEVKEGDTVLVNGAAGRLGLATVDLAVNVYRCKVIAVCENGERASAVRDRGAFATIILGKQDVVAQVNKITEGKGAKIIIDTIGGEAFKQVVKCAADEAKIVVAGFASKKIPQFSGEELMENSFSIIGVSLEQYRKRNYEVYKETVAEVIEMASENLITPYKATHFPLEKVNEALDNLKNRTTIGKLVIDVK